MPEEAGMSRVDNVALTIRQERVKRLIDEYLITTLIPNKKPTHDLPLPCPPMWADHFIGGTTEVREAIFRWWRCLVKPPEPGVSLPLAFYRDVIQRVYQVLTEDRSVADRLANDNIFYLKDTVSYATFYGTIMKIMDMWLPDPNQADTFIKVLAERSMDKLLKSNTISFSEYLAWQRHLPSKEELLKWQEHADDSKVFEATNTNTKLESPTKLNEPLGNKKDNTDDDDEDEDEDENEEKHTTSVKKSSPTPLSAPSSTQVKVTRTLRKTHKRKPNKSQLSQTALPTPNTNNESETQLTTVFRSGQFEVQPIRPRSGGGGAYGPGNGRIGGKFGLGGSIRQNGLREGYSPPASEDNKNKSVYTPPEEIWLAGQTPSILSTKKSDSNLGVSMAPAPPPETIADGQGLVVRTSIHIPTKTLVVPGLVVNLNETKTLPEGISAQNTTAPVPLLGNTANYTKDVLEKHTKQKVKNETDASNDSITQQTDSDSNIMTSGDIAQSLFPLVEVVGAKSPSSSLPSTPTRKSNPIVQQFANTTDPIKTRETKQLNGFDSQSSLPSKVHFYIYKANDIGLGNLKVPTDDRRLTMIIEAAAPYRKERSLIRTPSHKSRTDTIFVPLEKRHYFTVEKTVLDRLVHRMENRETPFTFPLIELARGNIITEADIQNMLDWNEDCFDPLVTLCQLELPSQPAPVDIPVQTPPTNWIQSSPPSRTPTRKAIISPNSTSFDLSITKSSPIVMPIPASEDEFSNSVIALTRRPHSVVDYDIDYNQLSEKFHKLAKSDVLFNSFSRSGESVVPHIKEYRKPVTNKPLHDQKDSPFIKTALAVGGYKRIGPSRLNHRSVALEDSSSLKAISRPILMRCKYGPGRIDGAARNNDLNSHLWITGERKPRSMGWEIQKQHIENKIKSAQQRANRLIEEIDVLQRLS
eukprot:NODE_361_length_2883_cov_4.005072_g306_i0.p1 GENE.NODE_361_length_2883_cov_4.005072_g306_i0~~NODE_361_length_2883_cov_4.005072_g306_i0.p1  ORF type:complete len:923 (-),score=223.93 NODE_361_length_2883_cov_4.005072_g306_i0:34-2802(-)